MSAAWTGLRRLLHIATRRGVERDVDAEIQFHLESRSNDLVACGHDPDTARALAEREFGNIADSRRQLIDVAQHRHDRAERASRWEALRHDVAFSLRALRRSPGIACTVIVLLALGIGANAATFAVADELFLRPPAGVSEPASLVRLYVRTNHTIGRVTTIQPELEFAAYTEIAAALNGRATLAAYTPPDSAFVRIGEATQTLRVVYATSNYFPVLGAGVSYGRAFREAENQMGAGTPVAVISHGMWQRVFGGDSAVLGKQFEVALARYTIIGVAAPAFNGPDLDRTDVWLPIAMRPGPTIGGTPWYREWRSGSFVRAIARPRPGVAPGSVVAVATAAWHRGERENVTFSPDTMGTVLAGPVLETLGPSVTPAVERAITSRLFGVTFIVLLIACANVANLLLLRGVRRRREVAVRLSLGSPRARLVRQLLIESTLLALAASIVAIAVAAWGGTLLRAMILPSVHWATSAITWRVVLASVSTALVTGVIAGIAPAWRASRTDLSASLKSGSREGGAHRSLLRTGLVVSQAALSVVLLAGAGLFVHSLRAVHAIDVGYDINRVAYGTVRFRDPEERYLEIFSSEHAAELASGLAMVATRLRVDPDVASTTLASAPPMNGFGMTSMFRSDGSRPPELNGRDPALIAVEPSYAAATGVKLVRGRFFSESDRTGAAPVVVVNETTARTYWPAGDALGQCLRLAEVTRACATVIGITHDAHLETIVEDARVEVFAPMAQSSGYLARPSFIVVRAAPGGTERAIGALRRELAREFPSAEPPYVMSMSRAVEPELRPWRLGVTLFSLFGALALIVASVGAYSVVAYAVDQRVHEMGIRIALGARRHQLVRLVLAQGMMPLIVGIAIGIGLTIALGPLVASMLYDTGSTNPLVLAAAAGALFVTGLLGSFVPARRATRVDPAVSLRAD